MNELDQPSDTSEADGLARLTALLDAGDEPAQETPSDEPPAEVVTQDAAEAESDEVTEDDLPDEAETKPVGPESLTITFNGEDLTIPVEEARALAQKGKLYDAKQHEIEQSYQRARTVAEQAEKLAEVSPQLRELEALVVAHDKVLQNFDHASLQRLAIEDPAAYVAKRAEFDALMHARNQLVGQYQSVKQQAEQQQQQVKQESLAREAELAAKLLPQWRDADKAQQGKNELVAYLRDNAKVRPQTYEAINSNAELLALAVKAARYDKLQASKMEKVRQAKQAPPVMKPGAPTAATNVNEIQKLKQEVRRTGSSEAARKLIERML